MSGHQHILKPAASNTRSDQRQLIEFLRSMLVIPGGQCERFHAVFVDEHRNYLDDAPLGEGSAWCLTVRMRDLFSRALAVQAHGLVIAHNHPSGQCRPSQFDIEATRRLKEVAGALDIEIVDHLILTTSAVYSMRAGGNL